MESRWGKKDGISSYILSWRNARNGLRDFSRRQVLKMGYKSLDSCCTAILWLFVSFFNFADVWSSLSLKEEIGNPWVVLSFGWEAFCRNPLKKWLLKHHSSILSELVKDWILRRSTPGWSEGGELLVPLLDIDSIAISSEGTSKALLAGSSPSLWLMAV